MSHVSASRQHAVSNAQSDATNIDAVRLAVAGMSEGVKQTALRCGWRIADAKRGRVASPLGPFPEMADEIIDAGGQFHNVTRPLTVMLAHLRRRCTSKLPADLKDALMRTKRECDEAEALGLRIAFAVNGPAVSDLTALDKEAADAEIALARLREMTQDKIAEATR